MPRLLRVNCLRAANVPPDAVDLLLPDEETPAERDLVKSEHGTLIWIAKLPDHTAAVVKMYRRRSPLQGASLRLGAFRARREYDALIHLSQHGVPCTEPLFWAHGEASDHGRFELLATRAIDGALALDAWLEHATDAARSQALSTTYRWVRAMHACGVRHGALSFRNVLVVPAAGAPAVRLIDFARSVQFPFDLIGTRMAWFDLADLTAKVLRRLGAGACAPALAAYGLAPPEAERLTRFASAHRPTRHLRRRLRLEFRLRARLAGARRTRAGAASSRARSSTPATPPARRDPGSA
jgi:hypothetical protein